MSRAPGSPSPAGAPRRQPRRTPDEARIIERFKRLAPQQAALKLATAPYCDDNGQFDRARWTEAFDSQRPDDIRDVKAVTGLYEGLVNHLVEMLHVAARLRGLEVVMRNDRPSGPELFWAAGDDGGLTSNQVDVLKRLYGMRNDLQHASPGVQASEVYDDILLLTKTLGRFAKSYIEWLQRHDISVI
ncbi:MAG TPA: hypothetical protein VGY30_02630 [Solirubrobacteraceae bacterium]|nr:hypothetical protein [Solirubrobacteraceae bacterium]